MNLRKLSSILVDLAITNVCSIFNTRASLQEMLMKGIILNKTFAFIMSSFLKYQFIHWLKTVLEHGQMSPVSRISFYSFYIE